MALRKEHQGMREGNILVILTLAICREVKYGKNTDHVMRDRTSQKTGCGTTALTLRGQGVIVEG